MFESDCVVLFKDKTFCFLAVLVLGLGIGGATTQFTVVNAIVLRGFSFPHPEQLVSVGLIDPKASDQNNNFGLGTIPTAQDYEDLKATQKSFSMMAGYLSGSTVNVTYKNNPQRYTGGYVTEDFFKIIGVSPVLGRDFTAEDNKPGAEKVAILGDEIWQRDFNADPNIVGQSVRINGKAATIIGVMPPNFKFPSFGGTLDASYIMSFRRQPRGDLRLGASNNAHRSHGSAQTGCDSRSGECGVYCACSPFGSGQSKDEPEFDVGERAAAAEYIHWCAISADRLGNAGRGHSRFADRLRERDEHAVRPCCIAGKRTGDSWCTGRDAVETRATNVDGESGGRGVRGHRGRDHRLLGHRFLRSVD